MNLGEIEQRVAALDTSQGFDLIYDLLLAYGLPKASIARLRNGSHNRSNREDERLWKGKVYYRFVQGTDDLHDVIDDASRDPRILRERPRFLIVRDSDRLLALDTRNDTTLDTTLADLPSYFEFFLPWAGIEKTQLENLNYADVKAAEKMARLYDEIIKHNKITTDTDVHDLNVFFSRLLFCFFAEDTGVFGPSQFTNAIASMTNVNGEDLHTFLDDLFLVLNTDTPDRQKLPSRFRDFGYVNGNLFNQKTASPRSSPKARRIVLECGTLDWSQINPDIFGSMIQAVVHPGQRESLGMHYTSVENIMKVIRPVFLDELYEAYDAAGGSSQKLQRLLKRIYSIRVFDPACGSGNFLIIAYKELRKLEHRILEDIHELEPAKKGLFNLSGVKLENFYGIEIDDFAHEIAILSLWLAKHQMNVEFQELFGVEISLIPLKDTGNVVCGNALRLDWDSICPAAQATESYVVGNPPYLGSSHHTTENKRDLALAFGDRSYDRRMDYVSAWFMKGAEYVVKHDCRLGFVATNSICQGSHVEMLWPHILAEGASIAFAYTSFPWTNQAKGGAGVTVVVVGLSAGDSRDHTIYTDGTMRKVQQIGPYLTESSSGVIVRRQKASVSGLPKMDYGSKPVDGGALCMSKAERDRLVESDPRTLPFIRGYVGSDEFLSGIERYCLWINEHDVDQARAIPLIDDRVRKVEAFRRRSSKASTRADASRSWLFQQVRHKETQSILVPIHTSERREYIPMGFFDKNTVISNAANAVYGAEPWTFGLIQSRMHMAWMRGVAGRLKTDYRYSAALVYNTFPVPLLLERQKLTIANAVHAVLDAREQFAERTMAELYDPNKMPPALRHAHAQLDETVDGIYHQQTSGSDEDRLKLLFEMYGQVTSAQEGSLNLA